MTRHIELHDGRVAMDVRLREVPELPAPAPKTVKTEGASALSIPVRRRAQVMLSCTELPGRMP